jgi:hypothetical protein
VCRAFLFCKFACFPEATELPTLQEGSSLARNSSVIPSPSIVPSATYIPWRDRPHLQLKVASEIAGVSPASLYRFSDEGRLKLRELGGRTLVDTKSLIALIESAKDWTPKNRGGEARKKRADVARIALQG